MSLSLCLCGFHFSILFRALIFFDNTVLFLLASARYLVRTPNTRSFFFAWPPGIRVCFVENKSLALSHPSLCVVPASPPVPACPPLLVRPSSMAVCLGRLFHAPPSHCPRDSPHTCSEAHSPNYGLGSPPLTHRIMPPCSPDIHTGTALSVFVSLCPFVYV